MAAQSSTTLMIQKGKSDIPTDFGNCCCSWDHMQCPSFGVLEASAKLFVGCSWGAAAFGLAAALLVASGIPSLHHF